MPKSDREDDNEQGDPMASLDAMLVPFLIERAKVLLLTSALHQAKAVEGEAGRPLPELRQRLEQIFGVPAADALALPPRRDPPAPPPPDADDALGRQRPPGMTLAPPR